MNLQKINMNSVFFGFNHYFQLKIDNFNLFALLIAESFYAVLSSCYVLHTQINVISDTRYQERLQSSFPYR